MHPTAIVNVVFEWPLCPFLRKWRSCNFSCFFCIFKYFILGFETCMVRLRPAKSCALGMKQFWSLKLSSLIGEVIDLALNTQCTKVKWLDKNRFMKVPFFTKMNYLGYLKSAFLKRRTFEPFQRPKKPISKSEIKVHHPILQRLQCF